MDASSNANNPFGAMMAQSQQAQPPTGSKDIFGMPQTTMQQPNNSFYQTQDPWNSATSQQPSTYMQANGLISANSTQTTESNGLAHTNNPFLPQSGATGAPTFPVPTAEFVQPQQIPPQYHQAQQPQLVSTQVGPSNPFGNPISPASSLPSGSAMVVSQFQSNPYASPQSTSGGVVTLSHYQSNPYASYGGLQQPTTDSFASNGAYQQQGNAAYQSASDSSVARVNPFDPFAPPAVPQQPPVAPVPPSAYPFPSPNFHQNEQIAEFDAFPAMHFNRVHANSAASEPAIPQSSPNVLAHRGSFDVPQTVQTQAIVPVTSQDEQHKRPSNSESQSTPSRPVRSNAEDQRRYDEPVVERQVSLRPTSYEYGQRTDVAPDRDYKSDESPRNKYALELARQAPAGASPLPKADLVRKKGFVLSRISFRTIVMKKWKQSYWVQYGPHTMLWFRSQSDFDDWLNNPYHSQAERNFLIKLAVNFVHDLYKPNVRGYQVTQARTKGYGNKLVRQFKLERWMDYGPTIAAAFGSYNPKEVDDLREALVECMRNTPLNNGIRATGAVRQRPPENIDTQGSGSPGKYLYIR
jgi:hypothetical protein